jgi:hypothetical protein
MNRIRTDFVGIQFETAMIVFVRIGTLVLVS